jgi:large subunit ribosomal protein L24
MKKFHIRKDDTVIVIAGSCTGKTGKVLTIIPPKQRAIVEGINYIYKAMRRSQDFPKGQILKKEGSIAISNLMLYCPTCKKGVKSSNVKENNEKMKRKCRKCGYSFDG